MLKRTHALAKDVLTFLEKQWLVATPQNFALGYNYKAGTDEALVRAVNGLTDGGVRMKQEEADELYLRFVGVPAAGAPVAPDKHEAMARHHALRLAEIAQSAATATGDFNRELSAGYERMGGGGSADISTIVSDMIARSEKAERELAAAAQQVEALRNELDVARHDATKDALTGLHNRRALDDALAKLQDAGKPYLVAICDVDRFKSVNDRYGHAVGDRVLKTVATSLTESCAPHMVGRWGGEEFLVILPGMPVDDGIALLDTARRDLGQRPFKLRETDEPMGAITFSAGVAMVAKGGNDNAQALANADAALYRAKDQGRNMVLAG